MHLRPRGGGEQVLLLAPDGHVPLSFHFTGMVLYHDGGDELLRVTTVPWPARRAGRCRSPRGGEAIAACYPRRRLGAAVDGDADALQARKAQRGDHSFEATVAALLEGAS